VALAPRAASAVFAVAPVGTSAGITTAVIGPPGSVAAVRGSCTSGSGRQVQVTWTPAISSAVQGYDILRGTTTSGNFTIVGAVTGRTTTAFTDGTVAASTRYFYAVRSNRSAWHSANSDEDAVTTPNPGCAGGSDS
jgi:hypothetical protein